MGSKSTFYLCSNVVVTLFYDLLWYPYSKYIVFNPYPLSAAEFFSLYYSCSLFCSLQFLAVSCLQLRCHHTTEYADIRQHHLFNFKKWEILIIKDNQYKRRETFFFVISFVSFLPEPIFKKLLKDEINIYMSWINIRGILSLFLPRV